MGKIEYSMQVKPMPGEKNSGDITWAKMLNDNQILFCLIDVAGHGDEARDIAECCISILEKHAQEDLKQIVLSLDKFCRGKRGLVLGLTLVDIKEGLLHYVGVGNIRTRIIGKQGYRFVCRSGTVGFSTHHPILEEYFLNDQDILIMYSDGISDRFDKKDYPEIIDEEIDLIPQKIIEKFAKNTDDMSCIAARYFA